MTGNKQIVEIATKALSAAFKLWLDENRNEIVRVVAASVAAKVEAKAEKPQPESKGEFLTPAPLAEKWGYHSESVRRLLRARRLAKVRVGRRILIPVKAVEEYERDGLMAARPWVKQV